MISSFVRPLFPPPSPLPPSSLAAHNGVVVRFVARCCDDATGTYIVIMWHGCRSRVVGSHQEALSYGERGLHPRAPCEAYTERASGLARGTPPYARHSAPRDSTRSLALLLARPTTSGSRALLVRLFRKGGGGGGGGRLGVLSPLPSGPTPKSPSIRADFIMNASLSNVVGIVVNRRILAALSLLLGRGREREEGGEGRGEEFMGQEFVRPAVRAGLLVFEIVYFREDYF